MEKSEILNLIKDEYEKLESTEDGKIFWLVTEWIKRKKLYQLEYMDYFEKWLYNYIKSWGRCDVFVIGS